MPHENQPLRLSLHGLAVELGVQTPQLEPEVSRLLGRFEVLEFPEGFSPVQGTILEYDELEVLRHVSSDAIRYTSLNDPMEVYFEQERFWLIDERWGMAEINLLKGQWRSWLLPRQRVEPARVVELAVLWPLAQLLRSRGLHVVPGIAVVRDGWGALLISPVEIEREMSALLSAGFRIVAQRWVALREEEGRIAMLHLPAAAGREERCTTARSDSRRLKEPPVRPQRGPLTHREADSEDSHKVDPMSAHGLTPPLHAFCDAVVLINPVRRPSASLDRLELEQATPQLRRAWPIVELHPHRRHSRLHADLARTGRCWEFRLSSRRHDLLWLLDAAQTNPNPTTMQEPSLRQHLDTGTIRRAG